MRRLDLTADQLISALLKLAEGEYVSILDSCGVGYLDSHLLIAGVSPSEVIEISEPSADFAVDRFEKELSTDQASIFTVSYDLGPKLLGVRSRFEPTAEPDLFLARFPALVIHDYRTGETRLIGDKSVFDEIEHKLNRSAQQFEIADSSQVRVTSNFSRGKYLDAIEIIKERIRDGDTYQTNLTHQLTAILDENFSATDIFARLRKQHPAPFSAFITRKDSIVISVSPERFFKVETKGGNPTGREGAQANRVITTSPIKGTRPRGRTPQEDKALKHDLLTSSKDRAENTMIVDLLRNDTGRVCEFGSVRVDKLCDLEQHPTFFHLVSTVSGELRNDVGISDILRAVFPCGSITGAPKISTMRMIDEIETAPRGLSMGAIGYHIPGEASGMAEALDLSVAIRTMVIRDNVATFNVGGGITIDSNPEKEWDETLIKARALLSAINGHLE